MPELPEVETVKNTLQMRLSGCRITHVEVLYPKILHNADVEAFVHALSGQAICSFDRRGKYMILTLEDVVLVSHLRMEGRYYLYDHDAFDRKHVHVIFYTNNGLRVCYHDTRKFGRFYLYAKQEELICLKTLGKEPWDASLTGKLLYDRVHARNGTLKALLLDQTMIAGIGNIYANEICFAMHTDPRTPVSALRVKDFEELIVCTRSILEKAIQAGGTTIRSYVSSLGVSGRFQLEVMVHGKEHMPCSVCQTPIIKIMVNQRGTYLCTTCQMLKKRRRTI